MKITLARAVAPIFLIFAAPVLAEEPGEKNKSEAAVAKASENADAEKPAAIVVPKVEAEEKRICRRVKLDMSSRRATKVCKTKEGWREFNQRR